MRLINDILEFISYLTFVDITFFVAIISMLILLVILVYFVKINKETNDDDQVSNLNNNTKIKSDNHKSDDLKNIVDKITLNPIINNPKEEETELIDLKTLTKKLEEKKNNNCVNFTDYEKDQEEKAIISYDELLNKQNNFAINYEKEMVLDDVIVKKVNLNDMVNKEKVEKINEVRVISYEKEEAFLSALKELNNLLN